MNNNYIFWRWSINNGEKVEKSFRKQCNPIEISNNKDPSSRENADNIYYSPQDVILETDQKMAHTQSIACDSINWSESNDILFLEHQLKLTTNNRREENYNKIAEREMVSQIGINPFFNDKHTMNNDSYIQDVINRDLFMKPINTNIEKNILDNNNNNNNNLD